MAIVTINEIFRAARLRPGGRVPWGKPIPENRPGVYVVALADRKKIVYMGQKIVYIGRTKRPLRKRLGEFDRHKYGARSPHRGGQAVLRLKGCRLVYWAATSKWAAAEHKMIQHFKKKVGTLPWANRVRSARES